jgi:NAD(P)-dependent dehydrogenase (short-subunit alcohol dehydrogenase family)
MANRFTNQVCLITGGSKGIGYSIAERLGQEGAIVHICSSQQKNVDEAVVKLRSAGYKVHGYVCDQSNK